MSAPNHRNSKPFHGLAAEGVVAPILVATDGHERSDGALHAAFVLAAPAGVCHVVAVLPALPIVSPEAQLAVTPEFLTSRRVELHRDLDAQLERVIPPLGLQLAVEIDEGDPAAMIVRAARRTKARLIVAGLGRHRMIDRLFGAETTLGLMRTASVPVLAVGREFVAPRRIVIAADFSEPSVRAARHALSIAGAGAAIDLVHVGPRDVGSNAWKAWGTEYERSARVALTKMQAKLRAPFSVTIHQVLLRGDPATELLRHATAVGADLIVTGSHGHGFVARMIIGSVATKIIRSSAVAVLTVPHMVAIRQEDRQGEPTSMMLMPRDDWDTRLDDFTRRNAGRPVVLEVDDPEIGARAQEHGYPLAGVSYDRHDHRVYLMLGSVGNVHQHLSRSIGDVTSIDVITDGQGRDLGMQIVHGAGETIVSFTR